MVARVQFQVNDGQVLSLMQRVGDVGTTGQAALAQGARNVEQRIRQTFRDEADPWGNPWPPHSPLTLALRARRGNPRVSLLIDSGKMFGSLRTEVSGNDATISIGGPDMWPGVHQWGNPENRAWGGAIAPIPARAMFPLTDPDTADLPDAWMDDAVAPLEDLLDGVTA